MGISWYLAVTGSELALCAENEKLAWLACHFSQAGTGLTNLPRQLREDTLVILDDSVAFEGHDPERIADQLSQLPCMSGLLLDLQRPCQKSLYALINKLSQTLPCPVAVTEAYARDTDCPVFVSAPLNLPLAEAIMSWRGRAVWLDIPFGDQQFILTREGCHTEPVTPAGPTPLPLWDEGLQCSYQIQVLSDRAAFTLRRSASALSAILQQAEALGIQKAISLRQEYVANSLHSATRPQATNSRPYEF